MRSKLIPIGNSKGVRIPKALLQQTGISGDVILSAEKDAIVIRPAGRTREGWEGSLREMHQQGDDLLSADEPMTGQWDEEQWEW